MKIAVIGCGAIGSVFLGLFSRLGLDVQGVVRESQKEALFKQGLVFKGLEKEEILPVKVDTQLNEPVDFAVLSVKINDLESAVLQNRRFIENAVFLTTQNGVHADYIVEKFFPKQRIITGIVMFGATFYAPNKVVLNFGGSLVLGSIFGVEIERFGQIQDILKLAFDFVVEENILGAKYLKVFVNLNNCIPAVLGVSMQEAFSDINVARVAILLNKEAYKVIENSGIELRDLPGYPKQRLEGLIMQDLEPAAELFSQIMSNLSKEPLYGSILQSIKKGRKSEIDYINGEIVKLAGRNNLTAPLNAKIIEMVHKVESTGKFFTKEDFLKTFNVN